jgi:hypothetical protein
MMPALTRLFDDAETTNFEVAMQASFDQTDASTIKNALIKAVAKVHPYYSLTITDDQCQSCGAFLEAFVGLARGEQRGVVFTTNYDLLLYWVAVRQSAVLGCHDGFDSEGYWSQAPGGTQAFYLHGGLHLYEHRYRGASPRLKKLLYERDRVLTQQIKEHLDRDEFPLFVTEGSSLEKMARIRSNPYLNAAYNRFSRACAEPEDALFVVGHGLDACDDHITDLIGKAQLKSVFVSTFGLRDRDRVKSLSELWARRRAMDRLPPLDIATFNVAECPIWSGSTPSGASHP